MVIPLWAAMAAPKRFAKLVPTEQCFAPGRLDERKVWKIIRAWANDKTFKPLVGIRHPTKKKIVIVDGHHRYHAYKRLGHKEIPVAVSDEFLLYPAFATGAQQGTSAFQKKVRPRLRSAWYHLTGRKGDDWNG